MSVRLIAELGSCHMGKLERIKEAIDICKETGIDALKLQLFPNEAPYVPTNIYLEPAFFTAAFSYAEEQGVSLSASVFDQTSFEFLLSHRPKFIKFAFSQKHQHAWIKETLDQGIEAIVSCDPLTVDDVDPRATTLFVVPQYPIPFEVAFDGIFPRFDGWSHHGLTLRQAKRAVDAGAQIIEAHVQLGYIDEVNCPDGRFSTLLANLCQLRK